MTYRCPITALVADPVLLGEIGVNARNAARIDAARMIVDEMVKSVEPAADLGQAE